MGRLRRSVPAAAGAAAATPAAAAERGGAAFDAVRCEDGELLADVRGAAVGAIGARAHRDELLVVGLALHADELVNRHPRAILTVCVGIRCGSQVPRLSGIFVGDNERRGRWLSEIPTRSRWTRRIARCGLLAPK